MLQHDARYVLALALPPSTHVVIAATFMFDSTRLNPPPSLLTASSPLPKRLHSATYIFCSAYIDSLNQHPYASIHPLYIHPTPLSKPSPPPFLLASNILDLFSHLIQILT